VPLSITLIDTTAVLQLCLEVSMFSQRWVVGVAAAVVAVSCADATIPLAPEALSSDAAPAHLVAATGHLAAGSGHVETAAGLREFTFHALGQPQGGVTGSFKVVLPNGLFFEADVTCLSVNGNTGWVGGTIRATNAGVVIVGSGSMFYAVDNGEGGGTADVVSVAVFNAAAGADIAFCANQPLELAAMTVTDGNVQVR
jgi:hypothetical protein